MLRYKVQYTWPGGQKVRYQAPHRRLTQNWEDAEVFTLQEASLQKRLAKDAKLVWDITTRRIKI